MHLRRIAAVLLLTLVASDGARGQKRPQTRPGPVPRQTLEESPDKLKPLDASPTLFYVLAAINAAGYDDQIGSPTNSPLRKRLHEQLSKLSVPSLPPSIWMTGIFRR